MKIAVSDTEVFEYVKMPPLNEKLQLLTKDNRMEYAAWRGGPPGDNKTYKAWARIPARNLPVERMLGYM